MKSSKVNSVVVPSAPPADDWSEVVGAKASAKYRFSNFSPFSLVHALTWDRQLYFKIEFVYNWFDESESKA